jgi:hypothetical protein
MAGTSTPSLFSLFSGSYVVSGLDSFWRFSLLSNAGTESMADMTRREVSFLLIGLGISLILAVAAIIEFVLWFHHAFILGISWRPGSALLVLPFLLVLLGSILLLRSKGERTSR